MQQTQVRSLGWEDTLGRGKWQPTPVFLPGETQGQRSLGGQGPGCHKEWNMTKRLSAHMLPEWQLGVGFWT